MSEGHLDERLMSQLDDQELGILDRLQDLVFSPLDDPSITDLG